MSSNPTITPPRLARKIFQWYCSSAMIEDLEGDLEELFYLNLKRMSVTRAKTLYWFQVISMIFSYATKKRKRQASYHHLSTSTFNPAMLKNYFIIATRNLAKHKFFTIINILGLAIGMSISLLAIAMLVFLSTYDNFHVNKDRIYRVITQTDDRQNNYEWASSPAPLAERLKNNVTGISEVIRINSEFSAECEFEKKKIPVNGYFVDKNFLDVFTFPLRTGNKKTALSKPNNVIITAHTAEKFFGKEDPMGKIISMGEFGDFEITGVLENIPKNSHMEFEILGSYEALTQFSKNEINEFEKWKTFRNSYLYLLLPEAASREHIEHFLSNVSEEVYTKDKNFMATFDLQALNEIVPGAELYNQIGPEWGYASLTIFIILTLSILLPACFNYANIAISRALKRMKEIGLRKVMGGERNQIFFQFITETVLTTLVALGLSYYIFILIKGEFLSLLVRSDAMDLDPTPITIFFFILFAIAVGVAAGFIPALYFARLNPIQALKSKLISRSSRLSFRKILTVGQFALSLGFIMSVVIVLNQYRQTLNYDFGFTQENILDVELQDVSPEIFKNEFLKVSAVNSISMSSHILGTSASSTWVKKERLQDSSEVYQLFVDENYLNNLDLKLLAGESFPEDPTVSKNYVIVNEEFLNTFSIDDPQSAINEVFLVENNKEVIVKGVVKNFHYAHLSEPIKGFFFRYDSNQFNFANLKITAQEDMFQTLSEMESTWKTFGGENKFIAQFFDDEIKDSYSFYFSMIKICGFLGLLAISISCLGMLGMVVFTVENRMKEVGVRKVMGATIANITVLLSRDFIKLMLVAAMIAAPVTYLFFDKLYLTRQYYKIDIGVLEVAVSLLLMLVVGLATILSQTVRAAKANPVDTLRNE